MSDDTITLEIDGQAVQAKPGQMLIEVTDSHGTYVPRFCYHKKLTVAANCRMCLVEVEKAPKPLPACATPVMDGMVVRTTSDYARDAQKSVMEFLLINHPLDCPICDQGGECELQDLAMGYGSDVSRYQEKKRVVQDKNIGPLVQTEMTRCIHCTRCVRFGEEVAGMQELGSMGRGENMEISSYVEKSMSSELSGNIIDLCPVGALTSKPFRFSARTWEMKQLSGIAPHDGLGSNIHFHIKNDRVKRVVPAENESINEVWLSDRDRFSYEGLYSEDRLLAPMIKVAGEWQETDWDTALQAAKDALQNVIGSNAADKLGVLASASSSSEELYLLQKLARAVGTHNIDHRLGQCDFRADDIAPVFPWLGQGIAELENNNAVLIVGGNIRKEMPILNHRIRKAALKGAAVMQINVANYDYNFELRESVVVSPGALLASLGGVLKALSADAAVDIDVEDSHRNIAEQLKQADSSALILGSLCESHPQYADICALAAQIATHSGAVLGFIGSGSNSSGAALSGVLPRRQSAGQSSEAGLNAMTMLESSLPAYLLYNVEPELDCWDANLALQTMKQAQCVVAFSAYASEAMRDYADVLLPLAVYAENEGSYHNIEGRSQHFKTAVAAAGDSRPGWKVLRVLGNKFELDGFDYQQLSDVTTELNEKIASVTPDNQAEWVMPTTVKSNANGALQRVSDMPTNAVDALVRRAESLQMTADIADGAVHINQRLAEELGLGMNDAVKAEQGEHSAILPLLVDDRLADNTVLIHAKQAVNAELGPWFGEITLGKA